jgi:uroporphyrin-3 C-methyltransferase
MNTTPPQNSPDSPDLPPDTAQEAPVTEPATEPAKEPDKPTLRNRSGKPLALAVLAGLIALLLIGLGWFLYGDVQSLRSETARRLQASDKLSAETRSMLKNMQETLANVQSKVSTLESRQAESQNQQVALEQLYEELNKNRDDWALAEIEQVLSTAAQQLQLAGNVQGALIALENADRLLAQSDKPQFSEIRTAIASDIERLKALPLVDITSATMRLDSAISMVDTLPLLSAEKPAETLTEPKAPIRQTRPADAGEDWLTRLQNNLQSFFDEIATELRQVVRVRTVEEPEALLMSPTEAYFVRQNLKLRLLNARLALLSRNETALRNDLVAGQEIITRYFDTRAKQTQTMLALLKQVQNSILTIEMPTLSESLTAVRNYKAQP